MYKQLQNKLIIKCYGVIHLSIDAQDTIMTPLSYLHSGADPVWQKGSCPRRN